MALPSSRSRTLLALILVLFVHLAPASAAQEKKDGEGYEEFEEIDPYTKNDPEKFAALGYVLVGSLGWGEGNRTEDVQETMGGLDFLWVETEHFRIGSSLSTYKITNDKEERKRLKEEFAQLKKKLGRFKAPRRKLDPWMRLHLYAQRAENLYADFVKDFGLERLSDDKEKPYLGHPKKFRLLLCERKSELVRYLQAYEVLQSDISCGSGKVDDGMIFAINVEHLEEQMPDDDHEPMDAKLYCGVASGLVRSFMDGHSQALYRAPRWLVQAVDQYYARKVDPRWVLAGFKYRNLKEKHWEWDERVDRMVKNDFFPSMSKMIAWTPDEQQNSREHMIMGSKLEFMIQEKGEGLGTFLDRVVVPVEKMTENSPEELAARQTKALDDAFGLSPEAFDGAWLDWVKDR